jgi:hypothetical protein
MQFEAQVPNNYTSGAFMSLMEIWRVVGQALGSQYLSFYCQNFTKTRNSRSKLWV